MTPGAVEIAKREEKKPTRKVDFAITADELAAEFIEDGVAAHTRRRNKVVELTGEVDSALRNQVVLKGANKGGKGVTIICRLQPEFLEKANWLSKGQQVKVTGRVGDSGPATISVVECSLTELKRPELTAVSAEVVAGDYERNAPAAQAKYEPLDLVITGIVEKVTTLEDGSGIARLKGTGKTFLAAVVGFVERSKLERGQRIDFRADFTQASFADDEVRLRVRQLLRVK